MSDKVYLVFETGIEHGEAVAVFSDRAKAKAYADAMNGPEFAEHRDDFGHNGGITRVVLEFEVDVLGVPERADGCYVASLSVYHGEISERDIMVEWLPDPSVRHHVEFVTDREALAHACGAAPTIAGAIARARELAAPLVSPAPRSLGSET